MGGEVVVGGVSGGWEFVYRQEAARGRSWPEKLFKGVLLFFGLEKLWEKLRFIDVLKNAFTGGGALAIFPYRQNRCRA